MKKIVFAFLLAFLMATLFCACERNVSANARERAAVNTQQERFLQNQPPPMFEWSLERHLMTQLYQARNTRTLTYSYVMNRFNSTILMSCESIGFPIPGTTQLTNPQTVVYANQSVTTVGQAEPNGLYAPPSTHGTWIMCLAEEGGVEPRYVEDEVITTVRPMHVVNGELVPIEGQHPSITLRTSR